MSKHSFNGRIGSVSRANRTKKPAGALARRLRFENLEDRRLLTGTLGIAIVTGANAITGGPGAITSLNNSTGKELSFQVSDITTTEVLRIYNNGSDISGADKAVSTSGPTATVSTNGTSTLADGDYSFTAVAADAPGSSGPVDTTSAGYTVEIFTKLTVTSAAAPTSVAAGQTYTYTVTTNAPSGDAYTVGAATGTSLPTGMTVSGDTFTWSPTAAASDTTSFQFTPMVTDAIGNTDPLPAVTVSVGASSAPSSIAFQPTPGHGTAALTSENNSASAEMSFLVSGVTAGNTVDVYADSGTTPIASGMVASGATSITLASTGTSTLADGTHTFTATQSDNGVASPSSPSISVKVFTALAPTMTSALAGSATAGKAYSYTYAGLTTSAPSGDAVTYALSSDVPSGMTYNAATETVTWTPAAALAGTTQSFTLTATDALDNTATTSEVFVAVAAASGITVLAPPSTIAIGSPVLVGFNDAASATPTFSVTTSSGAATTALTATLMPQTNQVLKIVTSLGEMDFQLLDNYTPNTVTHFVNLVDSGAYANTSFYRIIQTFMDQGGTGGTGSSIPDELNALLRFTSSGLLAMANNGPDGNSSEFFVTNPNDMSDGFLDFRYTIFGKLVAGDDVRQAIAATPVTTNSSGEDSQPLTAPTILSMSVTTETTAGVFMLQAASGATGTYTVNVTDGSATQSFTITVGSNAYDSPNPWVATSQITTAAGTPVTFTPGASANGTAVQVSAETYLPVPNVADAFVDDTYVPTIAGSYELEVGTATTAAITFNSTNPATTATAMQTAIDALSGLSGTTVTALTPTPSTDPTTFSFTITFAASQSPITYVTASSNLQAKFANSVTASATSQTLTFTYDGLVADTTNPDITLTKNNNGSYTVTPAAGYSGVQFLKVEAMAPAEGTFELEEGSTSTASITFDSTNLATTAANMQSALVAAGFSGATVTAVSGTELPDFSFDVTFTSSESPLTYVAASTALPVTFTNSATASVTTQTLTFAATGTSWDSKNNLSPLYTVYVPVFVGTSAAPAAPQIAAVDVGGKAVSGTTAANNSTTATAFSFNITGATAGDTLSVYMDGGAVPVATGTAAATGTYELQVGSTTTAAIDFSSADPTDTASAMQSALVTAGFTGATVSASATTAVPYVDVFKVTFASSEPPVTYVAAATALPVTFTNSVSAASATQQLTFDSTITLTTNGTTRIADGSHQFTVKQATPEATLYSDWKVATNSSGQAEFGPGSEIPVPVSAINSAASAGTALTIGLSVLTQPATTTQAGTVYTYTVTTTAPSGDTVTVTPVTIPAGMTYNATTQTFTWTPTTAQLNTPLEFDATVTDSLGNSTTIGPLDILATQGLAIPVTSSTGNVTVSFSGSQVVVSNNSGKTTSQASSVVVIDCTSGEANYVSIMLPSSVTATMPKEVLVEGTTSNQVTVVGSSGANTFTVAGTGGTNTTAPATDTITGNGMKVVVDPVQKLTLKGGGGNNYYWLNSSALPTWIVATGSYNTLDFSKDTAGVSVNLGLQGKTQPIAPWNNTTLTISGAINELIGTKYADDLTGGSGQNIILGGGGNDTIVGGTGENLIVTGAGNCNVYTNGTENMVLCGTTNWDSNGQALLNLLEQGPLFMYSYSYRRAVAAVARNPALQSSILKLTAVSAHDTVYGSLKNSLVLK